MRPLRLLTFDPCHPDAARVQSQVVPDIHPRCYVYGPLGPDLLDHLGHLAAFNGRPDDPTGWAVDVRAGSDWLDRALREQPGNTVVLAGRPDQTLDRMLDCVQAGLHVLATEPWAMTPADVLRLAEVYRQADIRELVVWPLAVEPFDPAVQLLIDLVSDPAVCGDLRPGTPDQPAVVVEATRPLRPAVAGRPVLCPAWTFDPAVAGDALTAAGPLADLILRLTVPDRLPDPVRDVVGVDGTTWPGLLAGDRFRVVTGRPGFAPELAGQVHDDTLAYPANGTATAVIGGVAVRFSVLTEIDHPDSRGNVLEVTVQGRQSTVQAVTGGDGGEVVVTPGPDDSGSVFVALARRCQGLQPRFPGLSVQDLGGRFRLAPLLPADGYPALLAQFVRYFRSPRQVPAWERAAALARSHLTTTASEAARRKQAR